MKRLLTTTLALAAAAPALAHPGAHAGQTPTGLIAHMLSQADHLAVLLVFAGIVALAVVVVQKARGRRG